MQPSAYETINAPPPAGPYSQAKRRGDLLAVAGQVGIDPTTGKLAGADIKAQARQAFDNVQAVLREAGASMDDVLMIRVYLTDPEQSVSMNEVYAGYVAPPYPSRTTVYVGLPPGMLIEVDALAVTAAQGT